MEMPDTIYAIKGVTNRFDGVWDDYQWSDQRGAEYHHSRIVEALRRENEELKAKLDKANDALKFYGAGGSDYWDAGKRARETLEEIG